MAKKSNVPADQLARYLAALETVDGSDPHVGPKSAYTSVGGHMATTVSEEGLWGVRLAEDEILAWMEEHGVERYRSRRTFPPAKVLVDVPEAVWSDADALATLFQRAHDHAASLPPKPGK